MGVKTGRMHDMEGTELWDGLPKTGITGAPISCIRHYPALTLTVPFLGRHVLGSDKKTNIAEDNVLQ